MGRGADLVLVRDRQYEDMFVSELVEKARAQNLRVDILAPDEYVSLVAVEVRDGSVTISPDIPTIVRWRGGPVADSASRSSTLDFVDLEIRATLRACLAMMTSKVVNRPQEVSTEQILSGRPSIEAVIPSVLVRPEMFQSEYLLRYGYEAQDLSTYASAYTPDQLEGVGPYRIRRGSRKDYYLQAVIVSGQIWASGPTEVRGFDLGEISCALSSHLDLPFVVITWNIPADRRQTPAIARIDPVPTFGQMSEHAAAVARALVSYMTC